MIQIANNGPDIVETNYWDSKYARNGYFFLSTNAGYIRLLIPDSHVQSVTEIKTGEYVVISRGKWREAGGKEGIEIMFEDHSDSPFALHLGPGQWDVLPLPQKGWRFSAWTSDGKIHDADCFVRLVKYIPWMKPWKK